MWFTVIRLLYRMYFSYLSNLVSLSNLIFVCLNVSLQLSVSWLASTNMLRLLLHLAALSQLAGKYSPDFIPLSVSPFRDVTVTNAVGMYNLYWTNMSLHDVVSLGKPRCIGIRSLIWPTESHKCGKIKLSWRYTLNRFLQTCGMFCKSKSPIDHVCEWPRACVHEWWQ